MSVAIAGFRVPILFTPTSYRWAFGDGSSRTGAGIKGADVGSAGAVEYAYRRSGGYDITLSRSYKVRVDLPNGHVITLGEQISTPVHRTSSRSAKSKRW